MVKFTDLYLKNLTPRATRYDVREGQGFGVRVSPDGARSFFFMYQLDGRKRRMTLGQYPDLSLKKARRLHTEARALLARHIDPIDERDAERERIRREREERARLLTVERMAHEYIERHAKPNKRTWEHDEYLLGKDVLPFWGKRKAADITRRDVNLLLDGILDRGSPILANRVLSLVRKLFNFGLQRGELSINPCAGVSRPAPEHSRERVLSDEELRRLYLAIDEGTFRATEQVCLAIRVLLFTALRVREVVEAPWAEMDLATRWWEIPPARMKNKNRPHRVWLTDQAVADFRRLQALGAEIVPGSDWVFPSPAGDKPMCTTTINKAITRNLKALDLDPFSPHDLRRTVATRLGELGILPHVVGKVLSHTDGTVTGKHYDKWSYDREKKKALEAWAGRLQEIVSGVVQRKVIPLPR